MGACSRGLRRKTQLLKLGRAGGVEYLAIERGVAGLRGIGAPGADVTVGYRMIVLRVPVRF
jgi:hypothetical protein